MNKFADTDLGVDVSENKYPASDTPTVRATSHPEQNLKVKPDNQEVQRGEFDESAVYTAAADSRPNTITLQSGKEADPHVTTCQNDIRGAAEVLAKPYHR